MVVLAVERLAQLLDGFVRFDPLTRQIDAFQVYLRELRVEDLEGSEGIYRLREELHSQINAAIAPARVNNVLFGEMMIL